MTSARLMPSFLASTTSCSTSFASRRARCAAEDPGGSAITVPVPARTSRRPSFKQLGDYFVRRVGVDAQFRAERAHGRKGVAGAKLSADQRLLGGIDDLLVERGARAECDPEWYHGCMITASTPRGQENSRMLEDVKVTRRGFLGGAIGAPMLLAQSSASTSTWNGYEKRDFTFRGHAAYVVLPRIAARGQAVVLARAISRLSAASGARAAEQGLSPGVSRPAEYLRQSEGGGGVGSVLRSRGA